MKPEKRGSGSLGPQRCVAKCYDEAVPFRPCGDFGTVLRQAPSGVGLIASVPLNNVTSRFAMERLKRTAAYPLAARAFRDRRANDSEAEG